MKAIETPVAPLEVNPTQPLSPEDLKGLADQLQEAFPAATEKLLTQAIEACRLESEDPDDRQKLIRCVVERITA